MRITSSYALNAVIVLELVDGFLEGDLLLEEVVVLGAMEAAVGGATGGAALGSRNAALYRRVECRGFSIDFGDGFSGYLA